MGKPSPVLTCTSQSPAASIFCLLIMLWATSWGIRGVADPAMEMWPQLQKKAASSFGKRSAHGKVLAQEVLKQLQNFGPSVDAPSKHPCTVVFIFPSVNP